MYKVRLWSIKRARMMEMLYASLEKLLVACAPVFERIGYERLERPVAAVENTVKSVLFDCQMCGQCALSKTGMSCPMNCPKSIRNGPCGGVRVDGYCEVKPEMRCVWVEAWAGSQRMKNGGDINIVQVAIDHRLKGSSSWLREVRSIRADELAAKNATDSASTNPS